MGRLEDIPTEPGRVAEEINYTVYERKGHIWWDDSDGGALPFKPEVIDFVCCCDALAHVGEPARIIAEVVRVLKSGGIFFYDTVNRTLASWLVMIKIMQAWKATAFLEPDTHLWRMFIKPKELITE